MARALLLVALLGAPVVGHPAPGPPDVPLAVEEPSGVARRMGAASASVPFPPDRLRRPDDLWIAGPDGSPVHAQGQALEHWPDGSVRWLLVDFLASVRARETATFALREGSAPSPPAGAVLRVDEDASGVTIDTGMLRIHTPAGGGSIALAPRTGPRLTVPLPDIQVTAGPPLRPRPEQAMVETRGPVRTELLLRGRYPQSIAYELRVAAFAGQSAVRLQLTLVNDADAPYTPIRAVTLAVPCRASGATVGIDGAVRRFAPGARHELRQTDATVASIDGRSAGSRADGWMAARLGPNQLTLVSRYVWEEYPQAIGIAPDGVRLVLLAGGDTPVRLGTGAAKTFEMWLDLAPVTGAPSPSELVAAVRAPLVGRAPAEWVVGTRALLQALAPADDGAKAFLVRLTTATTRYLAKARGERWDEGPAVPCGERREERPRVGFYGALNWGDWNFPGYRSTAEGCDAWGNLEYDLPQVLGLGWVATGNRLFYDAFVPAARHYRDVDVIHHWPGRPEWVGLNHPHKANHFAIDSPNSVDLGHTWLEGLLTHYRLTGEVRSLAAARGIADALVRLEHKAGNPRQFGWPLIALVAMYQSSNEQRYLDAAVRYAAAAVEVTRPTPEAGDWKIGILADGLSYAQAANGDPRLRRWLIDYATALVGERETPRDPRYFLPIGQVALVSGENRFAAAALDSAATLEIGEWGKPLAVAGRTGFRLLAPLALRRPPPD